METGGPGYVSSSLLIKRVVRVGFTPPVVVWAIIGRRVTHDNMSLIIVSMNDWSLNDVSLRDVHCVGGGGV